jgi:outer membrane immunogenic protein
MKKTLLACSVLAAFSGAAFAADMPAPPPAYAPVYKAPPPAPSFTGCYIDGGIGYGVSNIDHNGVVIATGAPTSASTTSGGRGWLGRAGGGCDYQFTLLNTWPAVVGLLGDYDFSNISGTTADPTSGFGGNLNQSDAWYAGARVGLLPMPNLLTYVDGGYTQSHFDRMNLATQFTVPPVPTGTSLNGQTFNGWFIGGGTEYAFTWLPINGLFWRTEYRYSQYQAANVASVVNATGLPTGFGQRESPQVQTVTTSLVWRFNWGNW